MSDDPFARFRRNWLAFDATRPTRPRLAWRFVAVVLVTLLASATLMLIR